MSVATIEAIYENGHIRLPKDFRLPEHTKVYVVIPDAETQTIILDNQPRTGPYYIRSPRLVHPEQAVDFKKVVVEEAP